MGAKTGEQVQATETQQNINKQKTPHLDFIRQVYERSVCKHKEQVGNVLFIS